MKKYMLVTLSLLISSCVSDTKKDADSDNVIVVTVDSTELELKPAGTIGDLLGSMGEYPNIGNYESCEQLISALKKGNYKIESVSSNKVVAITSDNKRLTHTLGEYTCDL